MNPIRPPLGAASRARNPARRALTLLVMTVAAHGAGAREPALRELFADDFAVGVALNTRQVAGRHGKAAELAGRHFSSLTAENDMKWQLLQPEPGRYNFRTADTYFRFAENHGMEVIGHTLVWHSQMPRWAFEGENGDPPARDDLLERMRDHIHAVVGRYKGRVKGWDVVNEALSDDGEDILRDSPWRRIIGDDFIDHAFRFANEADPDAELYYNDYSLENPRKRANCVQLLKGLIERGVPIDGVGTQSHFQLNHPPLEEIERTIEEFAALGLKVMVTELDVDPLPSRGNAGIADISRREQADAALDPYTREFPEGMQGKLADRYAAIFDIYLRHRDSIARVTFWGLHDGQSWLNDFPIRGRTNHPLLFDRDLEPKPAFHAVVEKGRRR